MRWFLLKQLSRFHYQKAASDIIQETGDPEKATAEAIFERGNETLAENLAQYAQRPRKVPRICGRLATGRAFSLRQVKKRSGKVQPGSRASARRMRRLYAH
jgi:hypothetical protein